MKNSTKTVLKGTLFIIIAIITILLFLVVVYIYQDLKKVENGMFNLYNQVRTQNDKMDKISVSDEKIVQQSLKFTEATKNWQLYQDNEFGFQLKSPVSWGTVVTNFNSLEVNGKKATAVLGKFSRLENVSYLNYVVVPYDDDLQSYLFNAKYASHELASAVSSAKIGECSHLIFEIIKTFNLGEIRNCQIQENILNQKFVVYRSVKVNEGEVQNSMQAIYPRSDYYLKVNLPDEVEDETDYFIQSVIFMK